MVDVNLVHIYVKKKRFKKISFLMSLECTRIYLSTIQPLLPLNIILFEMNLSYYTALYGLMSELYKTIYFLITFY